jgi:pimeloyl-ACP methyl ester carboxylesterase
MLMISHQQMKRHIVRPLLLGGAALLTGAVLASLDEKIITGGGELYSPLDDNVQRYAWKYGDIAYTVMGDGPPLVLFHSINAGASSFEWRLNARPLAQRFRVYVPDLLGYGLSDRPALRYSARTFVELVTDFTREVVGERASVLALSLTAAFVVQAAYEHPELFERLILIEPTGVAGRLAREPNLSDRLTGMVLSMPVLGTAIFTIIVSRWGLKSFLRGQAYYDRARVSDDIIDYDYLTSHQPGAIYVPRAFLSGQLNINIAEPFVRLAQPVLLVWGRDAGINPLRNGKALAALNPQARLEVFGQSRLLPHEEHTEQFNRLVMAFALPSPA